MAEARRIAVIGVGSELRGDDIAGVSVARRLIKAPGRPSHLQAFAGCTAPENITGEVIQFLSPVVTRRTTSESIFLPDVSTLADMPGRKAHIILVDAAQMGLEPGLTKILPLEDIEGTSFSTHVLPLAILISYFTTQVDCGVTVIGIQPKYTDFCEKPSPEVRRAITAVSSAILASLS